MSLFTLFCNDVIEHVYLYLDGISLMNSRLICKLSNYHYERLLRLYPVWETRCRKEIPQQKLLNIVEKLFPTKIFNKNVTKNIDWHLVYKRWVLWESGRLDKIDSRGKAKCLTAMITCLKLCGDQLNYATQRNESIDESKIISKALFHDLVYMPSGYEKDFRSKYTNISTCDIDDISDDLITRIRLTKDGAPIMAVGTFDLRRDLKGWIGLKLKTHLHKMTRIDLNIDPNDIIDVESFVKVLDNYVITSIEECSHSMFIAVGSMFPLNRVIVSIKNTTRLYDIDPIINEITCLVYHCGYIFLGNTQGILFTNRFDNFTHVSHLSSTQFIQYKVNDEPITGIDILYSTIDNYYPILVVSTLHYIHFLRLCFKKP